MLTRGLSVPQFKMNLGDVVRRAKLQADFIDYVVAPLWSHVVDYLPTMGERKTNLMINRDLYRGQCKEGGEEGSARSAGEEAGAAAVISSDEEEHHLDRKEKEDCEEGGETC